MDEVRLVTAAMHGDISAFEELVRAQQRVLVASAYQLTGHADDAEDLVQEALLEAYAALGTLRDPARFRAWLFAILRHKCYTYLQQRKAATLPLEDYAETLADPAGLPPDLPIADLIARLPLAQREILLARYLHDMSYREIAVAFHITEMTARVRCLRARAELRKLLTQTDTDDDALRKVLSGLVVGVSARFTADLLARLHALPTPAPPVLPGGHLFNGQPLTPLAAGKAGVLLAGAVLLIGGGLLCFRHHAPAPPRPQPVQAALPLPLPSAPPPGVVEKPGPVPRVSMPPPARLPRSVPSVPSAPVVVAVPAILRVPAPVPAAVPRPVGPVELTPVKGFNLKITARPAANHLVVKPDPPVPNWFAGKFDNLPVGQPVTITIDMQGCDVPALKAEVGKWAGLRPVYTYADPEQYASYEWFRRDSAGDWQSGDLFKDEEARQAGTGRTPSQSAIPAALAEGFLGDHGAYWSPWGEIEGGQPDAATQTFTFTVTPAAPEMTIAMHMPYLLAYEQQLLARLQAAHFPGVFIDQLSRSASGNPLYIIRVDDPEDPTPIQITPVERPHFTLATVGQNQYPVTQDYPRVQIACTADHPAQGRQLYLLGARENPTEHTGSWVVLGALKALVTDTPEAHRLRRKNTWLLLPIADPDGANDAQFFTPGLDMLGSVTIPREEGVREEYANAENLAYIPYLRAFFSAGWFFADTASFMDTRSVDMQPVCGIPDFKYRTERSASLECAWFHHIQAAGVPIDGDEASSIASFSTGMLMGNGVRFMSQISTITVNDRNAAHRLALDEIDWLGEAYPTSIQYWNTGLYNNKTIDYIYSNQHKLLNDFRRYKYELADPMQTQPSLGDFLVRGY